MKLAYLSLLRVPTRNAHGFQIMNTCSALSTVGVEATLLVPFRSNVIKDEAFKFYNLTPSFKIQTLPALDLYFFRFVPEIVSNLILKISFLISARVYLWFNNFDVVYTRESGAGLLFKNFVFEVHMPEQFGFSGFKPKKLVVINNYIKERFLKLGFSEENILVSPDAVDLEKFFEIKKEEARKKLGLSQDKKMVLYWGNFKSWKGVDTLAEAARFLPELSIYLIGGTKDSDIERIKNKVRGLNNVLVEGFKDQSEAPYYMASADVLVLPNTAHDENSQYFTSPLKLFEYMAAEKPIVASDLPSLREIIDAESAIFFTPDDPQSLAESIRSIIDDGGRASKISKNARMKVENYTWIKRAQDLKNFIKND